MTSGNVGGLTSVLNKRRKQRGAQLLVEIEESMVYELRRCSVDGETAKTVAAEIRKWFRDHYGGQLVYFPQEVSAKTQERNDELMARFTGDNVSELSSEFRISEQQVYKIIREAGGKKRS